MQGVLLLVLLLVAGLLAQAPDRTRWRSYDGSANNVNHPTWGTAGSRLARKTSAFYADNRATERVSTLGGPLNSARVISNIVHKPPASGVQPTNKRGLTDFVTYWGQFIDHDISLTGGPKGNAVPLEPVTIQVPVNDQFFGNTSMTIYRSIFDRTTGTSTPREQVTLVTSFLDGSMIYGSDNDTALALRSMSGGLLKTGTALNGFDMPPLNTANLTNQNDAHVVPDTQLYLFGDVRGNENPALTSLHILFLREHNRRAKELAVKNPTWTDEELYQEARRFVVALIQHITFEEYYTVTLGDVAPEYEGYNNTLEPWIFTEFSTGAFRYGHSEVAEFIWRVGADGNEIPEKHLKLRESYFNSPSTIGQQGIDPILRGMGKFLQNAVDLYFVDDLRNFLNGQPGKGGLDLAAVNIQRGRDHGIPPYNEFRKAYGLAPKTTWAEIHPDKTIQALLAQAYKSVDDCDIYVCGLAEYHDDGVANVGETFVAAIDDQYLRIRASDRFWYDQPSLWTADELTEIKGTTLSDVIIRNTPIKREEIQCLVFALPDGCGKPIPTPPGNYDFVITMKKKTPAHPFYGRGHSYGFAINGVEGGTVTVERGKKYNVLAQVSCNHAFIITTTTPEGLPVVTPPPPAEEGEEEEGFADMTNLLACLHQDGGKIALTIKEDNPDMFYQCDFHILMGGNITVKGEVAGVGSFNPIWALVVILAAVAIVLL